MLRPTIGVIAGLTYLGLFSAEDPKSQLRVEIDKFIEILLTNEAYADEYYTDQTIKVIGKVKRVRRSYFPLPKSEEEYLLELEGANTKNIQVLLFFGTNERKQLAKLKPGQIVTVKGLCGKRTWEGDIKGEERYNQIQLRQCKLIETE